jgi:hypothetical protein
MATLEEKATWAAVEKAAIRFSSSTTGNNDSRAGLHEAVLAYFSARQAAGAGGSPSRGASSGKGRSGQVVPFGRTKGLPLEEAETKDLQWLAGAMRESIADPSKEQWAAKNRVLLDAIEAELETR